MESKQSQMIHNSQGQVGMGKSVEEVRAIMALISQRRRQVIVHSYLYYDLGREIVTDQQWDKWARELVQLQQDNPELSETCIEAWQFRGFDATTGFNFEYPDWVKRDADRLLKQQARRGN